MVAQLTPYLTVRDARGALAWYGDAFGAHQVGDAVVLDDDRIGHAELDVGGARVFLADEHPELGLLAPGDGRTAVTLHLTVGDVDAAVDRAEAAGADVQRPPGAAPHGRTAVVVDPFGHRWLLQAADRGPGAAGRARPGDTVSLTLHVPDGARARDFYEAVLGWSTAPDGGADGWRETGVSPEVRIRGGRHEEPAAEPVYAVDDIEVAVAAVRTAGGRADAVEQHPSGRSARCRDDQGLAFRLSQAD